MPNLTLPKLNDESTAEVGMSLGASRLPRLSQGDAASFVMRFRIVAAVLMLGVATGASATENEPVKSLLEMRQDQMVVQKWDLSCGAATLATILTYQHGDPVPEREIAKGLTRRK